MTDKELNQQALEKPAACAKCGDMVPLKYLLPGEGRCPACLAAEVRANAQAITAEFDRLLALQSPRRQTTDNHLYGFVAGGEV